MNDYNSSDSNQTEPATHRRRSDRYKTQETSDTVSQPSYRQTRPAPQPADYSGDAEKTREVRPVSRNYAPAEPDFRNSTPRTSPSVPRPASLTRAESSRSNQRASAPALDTGESRRSSSQPYKRPGADFSLEKDKRRADPTMDWSDFDEEEQPKPKKKHVGLAVAIIVVFLLAAVVLAFLLVPEDSSNPIGVIKTKVTSLLKGETRVAAQVIEFSVAPTSGIAPQNVVFNVTTSTSVKEVRIVDSEGNLVCTQQYPTAVNSDSNTWAMTYYCNGEYRKIVTVEAYDGNDWITSEKQANIDISGQPLASDIPSNNLLPTDTPYVAPTFTPYAEPDESPVPAADYVPDYIEPSELNLPDETEEAAATDTEIPAPMNNLVSSAAETVSEEIAGPTMMNTATPSLPPLSTNAPVTVHSGIPLSEYKPAADDDENKGADDSQAPVLAPADSENMPSINPEAGEGTAKIKSQAIYVGSGKKAETEYVRESKINMPAADGYMKAPFGVVTFRGNAFRQNSAYGLLNIEDLTGMDITWQVDVGSLKGKTETFYGIGFGTQPAIVKWSKDIRANLKLNEEKIDKSKLKEVIVPALDGNIYFLDLDDGSATRDPIKVGFPMKGTPSVHTLGLPIMMVGQSARNLANKTGDIGLRVFDLSTGKQTDLVSGIDKRAYGTMGAFNTSALIDRTSDTMIALGTNGMLYTMKLNAEVSAENKVSIKPEIVSMKTLVSGADNSDTGTDSSLAMYQGYAYYADKAGYLHCIDTNAMKDIWAVNVKDETAAAVSMDFVNDKLCIFTGNTLTNRTKGDCQIRCIDAESGETIWETDIPVQKDKKNSRKVGALASPVIGQNDLSEYVYFTVTGLTKEGSMELTGSEEECTAALISINKENGNIAWAKPLDSYAYSSPVAVYNEYGNGWIIQGTGKGTLMMFYGPDGSLVNSLELDGAIEGSPAVYLETLVVGTTGKGKSHIYGIELK